jgi:hypothetical protein
MRGSDGCRYFPCILPSLARTKEDKPMEDENKEELETEEATEETSPEQLDTSEEEETEEDIDYKKELETLEKEKPPQRSEADKAKRALHFNAERAKELGLDPAEILGIKPKVEGEVDIDSQMDRKFAERDARQMATSDDEFKLIMWYMDNRALSLEEAHLLANKGRIKRAISEGKRANVRFANPSGTERRVTQTTVPTRSPEEQAILTRRGMTFNPKTKTYQGKFYEEYWDGSEWASRKLKR